MTVKNLIHTLYHYEIIKALGEGSDLLVERAKKRHSERLTRLRESDELRPLAVEFQDKLLSTIEDIPDATDIEKCVVREYIQFDDTPLESI